MSAARRGIATCCALAMLAASSADSACVAVFDTAVRGRFVRCESASFHMQASGADRIIERELERRLAETDPRFHDRLRESHRVPEGLVAVILVEGQVNVTPWQPGQSTTAEQVGEPQRLAEYVRYWWSGPPEACEQREPWSMIDLWIHSPCCDTFPVADAACMVRMRYAEPAPDAVRAVLAAAIQP
jgi:hypothetical protein